MNNNNNQREGASSNSAVGKAFELLAQKYLKDKCNFELVRPFPLNIGIIGGKKKEHSFDIGSHDSKIIVECKSHKWTKGNNNPSGKITAWNEAMYYFYLAPQDYRKIFFCLKHHNEQKKTLAQYYMENRAHLIPPNVEIWEYCEETDDVFIYNSLKDKKCCPECPFVFKKGWTGLDAHWRARHEKDTGRDYDDVKVSIMSETYESQPK